MAKLLSEATQAIAPRLGLKAYHGTPHKVDKFAMSKIGTGEGAQAYGHGLYFAENPNVAVDYQEKLASTGLKTGKGERFEPHDNLEHINVRAKLQKANGDIDAVLPELRKMLSESTAPQATKDMLARDIAKLEGIKLSQGGLSRDGGNLYQVNLNVQEEDLLDWDAPLSEQSDVIQKKLAPIVEYLESRPLGDQAREKIASKSILGSDIEKILTGELSLEHGVDIAEAKTIFSDALNIEGIKGIKYQDQMSRGAEGGTRNFVIFDEDVIQIAKENGIPWEEVEKVAKAQGISPKQALSVMLGGSVAFGAMTPEEAQAGVGSKLAMDYASRMKRADESFINTRQGKYHGTGSVSDFDEFKPEMTGQGADQYGAGFYVTTSPHEASGYAMDSHRGQGKFQSQSKGVLPLFTRDENLLEISNKDARHLGDIFSLNQEQVRGMLDKASALKRGVDDEDMNPLGDYFESFWSGGAEDWMLDDLAVQYAGRNPEELMDLFDNPEEWLEAMSEATGFDGVKVTFDDGLAHEIHWKPENLRSQFAEFNPSNMKSGKLLGAADPQALSVLGAAGLTGAGLAPQVNELRELFTLAEQDGDEELMLSTLERLNQFAAQNESTLDRGALAQAGQGLATDTIKATPFSSQEWLAGKIDDTGLLDDTPLKYLAPDPREALRLGRDINRGDVQEGTGLGRAAIGGLELVPDAALPYLFKAAPFGIMGLGLTGSTESQAANRMNDLRLGQK